MSLHVTENGPNRPGQVPLRQAGEELEGDGLEVFSLTGPGCESLVEHTRTSNPAGQCLPELARLHGDIEQPACRGQKLGLARPTRRREHFEKGPDRGDEPLGGRTEQGGEFLFPRSGEPQDQRRALARDPQKEACSLGKALRIKPAEESAVHSDEPLTLPKDLQDLDVDNVSKLQPRTADRGLCPWSCGG
jgi:hypothetical protein